MARPTAAVADGDEAAVEVQAPLLEVDVGPLESEDFVASHAGHGGEPRDRVHRRAEIKF